MDQVRDLVFSHYLTMIGDGDDIPPAMSMPKLCKRYELLAKRPEISRIQEMI